MKLTYEKPTMKFISLTFSDIITTSGMGGGIGGGIGGDIDETTGGIKGDQNMSGQTPEEDG